ncbi:MAG: HD-GYP domain-containing protein, partial [Aeoliella sp.]
MPATANIPPPTTATAGYVPISASVLNCLDASDLNVYFWNDRADRVVLFRERALTLSHEKAASLSEQCADVLYVRSADFADLCDRILDSLEDVMGEDSLAPTARFEVLQTAVSLEIDKSLRAIDPGHYLSLVDRIGGQIRKLVDEEGILPHDLFQIARHDAHTFSHVTNVAGYAVVLAERLGISDPSELDQIAVGAMLHDIGKRHVPSSILSK